MAGTAIPDTSLLTRRLDGLDDVAKWVKDLHGAGFLWHMEDDPGDIEWGNGWKPTQKEVSQLRSRQGRALELCYPAADIFDFYPCVQHMEYHDCPGDEEGA